MALNSKQRRFVEEYLVDLNATQAAIRAGYKESTAYSQGQRLLKKDEISTEVAERQGQRSERTGITSDRVLEELGRVGFSDLRECFTPAGNLKAPEQWPDNVARAVSSVEVVTRPGGEYDDDGNREIEYVHKIKLWDKNSALEKIAKHLGMFVERVQHTSPDGSMSPPQRIELVAPDDQGTE